MIKNYIWKTKNPIKSQDFDAELLPNKHRDTKPQREKAASKSSTLEKTIRTKESLLLSALKRIDEICTKPPVFKSENSKNQGSESKQKLKDEDLSPKNEISEEKDKRENALANILFSLSSETRDPDQEEDFIYLENTNYIMTNKENVGTEQSFGLNFFPLPEKQSEYVSDNLNQKRNLRNSSNSENNKTNSMGVEGQSNIKLEDGNEKTRVFRTTRQRTQKFNKADLEPQLNDPSRRHLRNKKGKFNLYKTSSSKMRNQSSIAKKKDKHISRKLRSYGLNPSENNKSSKNKSIRKVKNDPIKQRTQGQSGQSAIKKKKVNSNKRKLSEQSEEDIIESGDETFTFPLNSTDKNKTNMDMEIIKNQDITISLEKQYFDQNINQIGLMVNSAALENKKDYMGETKSLGSFKNEETAIDKETLKPIEEQIFSPKAPRTRSRLSTKEDNNKSPLLVKKSIEKNEESELNESQKKKKGYEVRKKLKIDDKPKEAPIEEKTAIQHHNRNSNLKSFIDLKAKRRQRLSRGNTDIKEEAAEIDSDDTFFQPQIIIGGGFRIQSESFDQTFDEVEDKFKDKNLFFSSGEQNIKIKSKKPFKIVKESQNSYQNYYQDELGKTPISEEFTSTNTLDLNLHQDSTLKANERIRKNSIKRTGSLIQSESLENKQEKLTEIANSSSSEENSPDNEKSVDNQLRRSQRERKELGYKTRGISHANYGFTYVDYIKYKVQPLKIGISLKALVVMNIHSHLTKLEIIGILGGKVLSDDEISIEEAVPCRNISESSDTHSVEMDPSSQVEAQEKLEKLGLKSLGWYHSHPTFQPIPSQIDQETHLNHQNFHKGCPYIGVIVAPYSTDRSTTQTKGEVFAFHVSNNETYKLSYTLQATYYLTKEDLNEIEKVIGAYKNKNKSVNFSENWKKGESYKTKLLNWVRALLEQNLNQINLNNGVKPDQSSTIMDDVVENVLVDSNLQDNTSNLFLGCKSNIEKFLCFLAKLV